MSQIDLDAGTSAAPTFKAPSRKPGRSDGRPLSAWLRVEPGQITDDLRSEIMDALAGPLLLHDHRWPDVLRGDEAMTMAVAIAVLHERNPTPAAMDLAMSAVLLQAASGNAAAAVVLAHGLAIVSHASPEREELFRLSDLWATRWPRAHPAA